jgi:hypothetical protein
MKQKKMVKSNSPVSISILKKSTNEIPEIKALLNVIKAIDNKEMEQPKKQKIHLEKSDFK